MLVLASGYLRYCVVPVWAGMGWAGWMDGALLG